jgi:tetratricopeptide (TPR) repeat protein
MPAPFAIGLQLRRHLMPFILLTLAVIGCSGGPDGGSAQGTPAPSAASQTPEERTDSNAFRDGMKSFNAGEYESAARDLDIAAKSDPTNHEASYYLARSLVELGRTSEAEDAFKEAISRKPDYAEAHFELGKLYFGKKEYAKALPYLKDANRINNKWPDALVLLGDNYRMLGQLNYAPVPYGKALGFDGNRADAYFGLGMTYVGLRNKIAARQQLRKLEPLDGKLAEELRKSIENM